MSKEFEEIILKKLENLETEVKDTKIKLQNLAKDTNQRLKILEVEVKDTGEVVKYLNNNFTKFDFEINRKIDTLFEANTVNKEKNDSLADKMSFLDEKSFNHDIRISNLEDKVLTA